MENKIDWQYLQKTLIFMGIAIVVMVALIVAGIQYEKTKFAAYAQSKTALERSHSRYTKLVNDLDLLHLYTQTYTDYKNSGLVGSERRLSWIETLESVNDVLKLPRLTYVLKPQEKFQRPKLKVDRSVNVNSTPMELTLELLHEEDLFAMLEGIQDGINNLFTIDSCSITRAGGSSDKLSTKEANLNTSCLLRWITVDVQDT